jgi:hypothetical protein
VKLLFIHSTGKRRNLKNPINGKGKEGRKRRNQL